MANCFNDPCATFNCCNAAKVFHSLGLLPLATPYTQLGCPFLLAVLKLL